ncbi:MAG: LytR C-terminal domain-containing protein [Acidimicrobiales bacterium]
MTPRRDPSSETRTGRAVLLVALVVVVGVIALSHIASPAKTAVSTGTTTSSTEAHRPAPTTTTSTTPPPPPTSVKVLVFNGTTAPHGAGYFVTKLQGLKYDALAPENGTTTTVTTSLVYVSTPGFMASAVQIASALSLPSTAVQASLPASAPVSAALVMSTSPDVVVLVGSDISGQSLGTTTTSSTAG